MVAEISWAKNLVIMQKCKNDVERSFYLEMTKKFGWTKDVNKPRGVSTYKIMEKLPEELSPYLPSEDDITRSLKEIE